MVSSYDLLLPGARAAGSLGNRQDDQQRRQSFQRVAGGQLPRPPKPFGSSYSRLQPQAPVQPAMQAPAQGVPAMPEPTDSSVLSAATKITQPALGAVGGLANVLDLPGSMVRDVFALENPLDQLLSPASAENRTTGEQLLEKYGLYDDGPSEDRGMLTSIGRFAGGLGVEVLLDPLTYLSGGLSAGLKAGGKTGMKAAGKIGLVDDSIFALNKRLTDAAFEKTGKKMGKREAALTISADDLVKSGAKDAKKIKDTQLNEALAQQLGDEFKTDVANKMRQETLQDAYFTWQLPFTKAPQATFLRGDKARAYARFMDKMGEATRFGKYSPVMKAAPIFSKAARNAKTPEGQRAALELSEELLEKQAEARGKLYEANVKVTDSGMLDYPTAKMSDAEKAATNKRVGDVSDRMYEYMEEIGAPRIRETIKKEKDGSISVKKTFDDGSVQSNVFKNDSDLRTKAGEETYQNYLGIDTVGEGKELTRTYADPAKLNAWKADLIQNDEVFRELAENGVLKALDDVKGTLKESLLIAQRTGVDLSAYTDDYASYASRLAILEDTGDAVKRSRGARANDPRTEFAIPRSPTRRNVVGGTAALQRMARTTEEMVDETGIGGFSGIKEGLTANEWKEKSGKLFEQFRQKYEVELSGMKEENVKGLFDELSSLPKSMAVRGDGFYKVNPAEAALRSVDSLYEAVAKAKGLRAFLRNQSQLTMSEGVERLRNRAKQVFAEGGEAEGIDLSMDATGDIFIDNLRFLRKVDIIDQRGLDGPATRDPRMRPTPGGVGDDLSPEREFEEALDSSKSDRGGPEPRNPDEPDLNDPTDFDGDGGPPPSDGTPPSGSQAARPESRPASEKADIQFTEGQATEADKAKAVEFLRDINQASSLAMEEVTESLVRLSRSTVQGDKELVALIKKQLQERRPDLLAEAQARHAAKQGKTAATQTASKTAKKKTTETKQGVVDKPASKRQKKKKEESPYPDVIKNKLVDDGKGDLRVRSQERGEGKINKTSHVIAAAKQAGVPMNFRKGRHWTGEYLVREAKDRIDGTWEKWEESARAVAAKTIENPGSLTKQQLRAVDILMGSVRDSDKKLAERMMQVSKDLQRSVQTPRAASNRQTQTVQDGLRNATEYAREILGLIDEYGLSKIPQDELEELRDSGIWTEAVVFAGTKGPKEDLGGLYARLGLDIAQAPDRKTLPLETYQSMSNIDKAMQKMRDFVQDDKMAQLELKRKRARSATAKRKADKELKEMLSRAERNWQVAQTERMFQIQKRPKGREYVVEFDRGRVDYKANANWVEMPSLMPLIKPYRSAAKKRHFAQIFEDESITTWDYRPPRSGAKEGTAYILPILTERVERIVAGQLKRGKDEATIKSQKFLDELERLNKKTGSLQKAEKVWIEKALGKTGMKLRVPGGSANTKTLAINVFKDENPPKWLTEAAYNLRQSDFKNVAEDIGGFIYQNFEKLNTRFPKLLDGIPSPKRTKTGTTATESIEGLLRMKPTQPNPMLYESLGGGMPSMGLFTDPNLLDANLQISAASVRPKDAVAVESKLTVEEIYDALGRNMEADGRPLQFSEVATARDASPEAFDDAMAARMDAEEQIARGIDEELEAGLDEYVPDAFIDSLPAEERAAAREAAQKRVDDAQKAAAARKTAEKKPKGTGLKDFVKKDKGRLDQSVDLGSDTPMGRDVYSYNRAAAQVGVGRMSLLAQHLDVGASNYDSILQSPSQDVAALIQELKKPYQSYEDFFDADIPQMRRVKMALAENNYLDTIRTAARQQDRAIRSANITPLQQVPDSSIRETLDALGVAAPEGVALNSAEGYDALMRLAKDSAANGNRGSAEVISSLANPLADADGITLGSRYLEDYPNPVAVIETAERLGAGKYRKGSGFTDLETLIESEPQVFSHAVDDLQDWMSSLPSSGLDYGSRVDQRSVFYQMADEEFYTDPFLAEGYIDIPMSTRAGRFLDQLDMADDQPLHQQQLKWLTNPANVNKDEDTVLGVSRFIAEKQGSGEAVTAGEVRDLIRKNKPQVQIVNLGLTGRQQYAEYATDAGNRSSYTEILVRLGKEDYFSPDNPLESDRYFSSKHFLGDSGIDDVLNQETMISERPFSRDILMHLRLNDYTNTEGKKLLLVQELQSDMIQDERKFLAANKNLKKMGLTEEEIERISNREMFSAPLEDELDAIGNSLGLEDDGFDEALGLVLDRRREAGVESTNTEIREIAMSVARSFKNLRSRKAKQRGSRGGIHPPDIGPGGMPEMPFIPTRATWKLHGLKSAAHLASEQGYDGIAVLNGSDIAKVVGGDPDAIGMHQKDAIGQLEKHFKKSREEGGLGGGQKFSASTGHAFPEKVDAENLKLDLYQWDGNQFGEEEKVFMAGIVPPSDLQDAAFNGYGGEKIWIKENLDFDYFEVFRDARHVGSFKVMSDAKKAAADLMNMAHDSYEYDALYEYDAINPRTKKKRDFSYETTEFLFDDVTRANAVDNVFYQGTPVNGGAKASIQFPVKDPNFPDRPGDIAVNEDWMKSQYKTLIVAYKQADQYSFVHEMGHLLRVSLRQIQPAYLERVEKTLGVKKGDWSAQIIDPATGTKRKAEEVFADSFMQWVKDGGKPVDDGWEGMWNKFKDFIVSTYRGVIRGSDIERQMRPEMHQFFDDIVGEQKYTSYKSRTLMDALDEMKYTSVRALNAMQEEIGPEDLLEAERAVLRSRLEKERFSAVAELKRSGVADAEGRVRTVDESMDELVNKMNAMSSGGKKIPAKMTVGKGNSKYEVSTQVDIKEKLAQFRIDQDVMDDVTRVYQLSNELTKDNAFRSMADWYDSYTNMFKSNVTTIWPSFHFRNLTSGAIQNALNDIFDPTQKGLQKYLQPYKDAASVMVGDSIEGLDAIPSLKSVSAEEATEELRKLAFRFGVFDSPGQHREIYGVGGSVSEAIPGSQKMEGNTLRQKMMSFMKRGSEGVDARVPKKDRLSRFDSFKPWKVAGGGGSVDKFGPARVGRQVGDLVEGSHRLGGFIALLKQGYDPAEAAKRIRLLHVDYSDLSSAERTVIRRLFPFYSFSKGMSKYLANEIYTKPGGKVANTLRAANRSRSDDVTTPDYISQGVSIPLGADEDGSRNFITGLGLMHESVLPLADATASVLSTGDIQKPLFEVGGMLNPVPKLALETMFNRSLFQEDPRGGRLLDDMDPPLGRTLGNVASGLGFRDTNEPVGTPKVLESVLSNSPASKFISTAKQVTDTRKNIFPTKALNTLTGFKVSKVSPQAQDQILRERASLLMNELGGRTFERDYIPEEALESLGPEQRAMAESLKKAQKLLADRAKQRKAIREMQQAQENN